MCLKNAATKTTSARLHRLYLYNTRKASLETPMRASSVMSESSQTLPI